MSDSMRNVFVSHIQEDESCVGDLKRLLAEKGYGVRDSSITSETPNNASNPDYIKNQYLLPSITWAGTIIVIISERTKDSEWVTWEIEAANRLGKRIIGVWKNGSSNCALPTAFENYGDALVSWRGDKIIDAIEGKIDEFYGVQGQLSLTRYIKRHPCK
ncbi:MAG: TIR domain-containing protein [Alphaproteobacteria bacterium]|nr:TIR domain-containing protein [Alphaproteobacteria bacterium]